MLITLSFEKSLIVEQFRGNYLKVDRESIATNAQMSWMKFYFCIKIPKYWQPDLLTNFQLWKYVASALFKKKKVKTFKTRSDRSESDSSMKICFSSFRLVASPDIVWIKLTWRDTFPHSLWQTFWRWVDWFSREVLPVSSCLDLRQKFEIRFRRRRVVKWNLQLSFGGWCSCRPRGQSAEPPLGVTLVECVLKAGRSTRGRLHLLLSNFWIGWSLSFVLLSRFPFLPFQDSSGVKKFPF